MASFLVRAFELAEAPEAGFEDIVNTGHDDNIDALFASGVTLGCSTEPLLYFPSGRQPELRWPASSPEPAISRRDPAEPAPLSQQSLSGPVRRRA